MEGDTQDANVHSTWSGDMRTNIKGKRVKYQIPSFNIFGVGVVSEDHGPVVHVRDDRMDLVYIVRRQNVSVIGEVI